MSSAAIKRGKRSAASARRERGHWMWLAVAALGTLYIGSTLLTPLYPIYRREFGFPELVVAQIYAAYAVGNLAVLFSLGRLSDQLGRKRTTLVALALTAASALVFLLAQSTAWLFAARIVNGFAAGLGAGAVTAWIAELEPRQDQQRASMVAVAGNLGGLALGALCAGVMAEYGPWPLRLPWAAFMAILVGVLAAMAMAPETIRDPKDVKELSIRPRLGVPRGIRMAFASPAALAFASFALGGFYAALIPGLLVGTLGEGNLAVVGLVTGGFFATAAIAAAATRSLSPRAAMVAGAFPMLAGLAMLVASEALASMALLVGAAILGGAGVALGYRSSLQIVNTIAPASKRAEVVSTYLLACYAGNALPVVGVGFLAEAAGPQLAHRVFAGALAVLICIAVGIGLRFVREK
ncbi:MAG TPA: MFS transporter [Usitatibacter sp.]|nr:MFS transporter [Usitatibacter sp.]